MKKLLRLIVMAVALVIFVFMLIEIFTSRKLIEKANEIIGGFSSESSTTTQSDGKSGSNEMHSVELTEESVTSEENNENQKAYEKMNIIRQIDWHYSGKAFSPKYIFEKEEDGNWTISSDVDEAKEIPNEDIEKIFKAFAEVDVESWSGFSENNQNGTSSESFYLNIYRDGEPTICVAGTNAFPEKFEIVKDVIDEVISKNIPEN